MPFLKGHPDYVTAKYGINPPLEARAKVSAALKERYKDKTKHPHYGKHCSEETKRKIREAELGKYQLGHPQSEEAKRKISKAQREHNSMLGKEPWNKGKHGLQVAWNKGMRGCYPKELIRRMLTCRKPNTSEQRLINLMTQANLPFKYVGDGQFILGGKCPDFINVNGKKQIIELFGARWHPIFDIAERTYTFAQYGFDTLVIWEDELADTEALITKVRRFSHKKLRAYMRGRVI